MCHQPEEERDCDCSLCHECDLWMMSGGDRAAVHLSTDSQFTSAMGWGVGGRRPLLVLYASPLSTRSKAKSDRRHRFEWRKSRHQSEAESLPGD